MGFGVRMRIIQAFDSQSQPNARRASRDFRAQNRPHLADGSEH